MDIRNPLDGMTWEQRFYVAWLELLAMEIRAEKAEQLLEQKESRRLAVVQRFLLRCPEKER